MANKNDYLKDEVIDLLNSTNSISAHKNIINILKKYEVKTVDKNYIPKGVMPKDAISEEILQLWQYDPKDAIIDIDSIISRYIVTVSNRVNKQNTNYKTTQEIKPKARDINKNIDNKAVAGGPPKKGQKRGYLSKVSQLRFSFSTLLLWR